MDLLPPHLSHPDSPDSEERSETSRENKFFPVGRDTLFYVRCTPLRQVDPSCKV